MRSSILLPLALSSLTIGFACSTTVTNQGSSNESSGGDAGAAGSSEGGTDSGGSDTGGATAGGSGGSSSGDGGLGGDGSGGTGVEPECTEDTDCAWSSCTDGACAKAVMIRGGESGTRCVVRDSGDVACWGYNWRGLLGDGSEGTHIIENPTLVAGLDGEGLLDDVVGVAVGQASRCALRRTGDVACWGMDELGALGNGNVSGDGSAVTPRLVVGTSGTGTLSDALSVRTAQRDSFCALRENGTAACWGANPNGTLGNGTNDAVGVPTLMSGVGGTGTLQSLVDVVAGWNSCAVDDSGQVYCSGSNQYSVVSPATMTPALIPGLGGVGTLNNAIGVSSGAATCALLESKQVACWGSNQFGQLGRGDDGPETPTPTPELVLDENGTAPLTDIVELATSGSHVCALNENGEVLCWGSNSRGQLGIGANVDSSNLPRTVFGVDGVGTLGGVISVGAGLGFTCAVREIGDVVCWGLVLERFEPEYELVTAPFPSVVAKPVEP